MFKLSFSVGSEEEKKLVVLQRKIKKHGIKVVLIEKDNSSLLLCGDKQNVFQALNLFQKERISKNVQVFISDAGKIVGFFFKKEYRGWREIFRNEIENCSKHVISFHFKVQIRKVISFLDLQRSADRNLIVNSNGEIIAECIPRLKSCEISFCFSAKTINYVKSIVFLAGLTEVEIKKI